MAKIIKKIKLNKVINYDRKYDVLYIGLKKGAEEEFVEVSPGINVELDSKGEVIGIEILNASRILKPVIKFFAKKDLETAAKF
jgi:uncharacterized protein YuzE